MEGYGGVLNAKFGDGETSTQRTKCGDRPICPSGTCERRLCSWNPERTKLLFVRLRVRRPRSSAVRTNSKGSTFAGVLRDHETRFPRRPPSPAASSKRIVLLTCQVCATQEISYPLRIPERNGRPKRLRCWRRNLCAQKAPHESSSSPRRRV